MAQSSIIEVTLRFCGHSIVEAQRQEGGFVSLAQRFYWYNSVRGKNKIKKKTLMMDVTLVVPV